MKDFLKKAAQAIGVFVALALFIIAFAMPILLSMCLAEWGSMCMRNGFMIEWLINLF
jgi:hypothetical protein